MVICCKRIKGGYIYRIGSSRATYLVSLVMPTSINYYKRKLHCYC